MKLKTIVVENKTYAETKDGLPLFVEEDGKELAIDVPHTRTTITRLNGESKAFRERAEKAEADLKKFDGIEDPVAALKAIETLANIDAGKLLTAGKVDEIKQAASKTAEDRVAAAVKGLTEKHVATEKERDQLRNELYSEKIGGSFNRSKFISEKAAIPADLMQARFGSSFKVEDGKIIAYDQSGNKLFSRVKAGDTADFDEALEILVDAYPYRDQILKGANHSGSGSRPGANGGAPPKSMTQSEFNKLPAKDRAARMAGGMTLTDA